MPKVAHIIRRRHARKQRKQTRRRRTRSWLLFVLGAPALIALLPLAAALGLAIWLYAQAASALPDIGSLAAPDPERNPTRFFDRSGETVIYTVQDPLEYSLDERQQVSLADLPEFVGALTLVAENGSQPIRAEAEPAQSLLQVWRYMLGLSLHREAGILATLAQNVFLPGASASGLHESLLELALTAEAKRRFTAPELLELHLNTNYYGNEAFGIEAASRVYLGKSATALDLAEAALLAAIPPAPRPNPIDDERGARQRGADLLLEALNLAVIDQAAYDDAAKAIASLSIAKSERRPGMAPEFNFYARRQAQSILDELGYDGTRLLARAGLRIQTTLDLDLYAQSECLARAHIAQLTVESNVEASAQQAAPGGDCRAARELLPVAPVASAPDQIAAVILDAQNGAILSLSGPVQEATRQPAVTLQPLVYVEGFLRRLATPASMVYDIPQIYPGQADGLIYTPANPDGRFHGPLNLRDAMAAGLLPPAVQVANRRGMTPVIRSAHRLGFNSLDENRVSLEILERGGAVSVLDTAYAYSVFAAMGRMRGLPTEPLKPGFRGHDPLAILSIADADGAPLWRFAGSPDGADAGRYEAPVLEPSLAYMVNDVLADAAARQRILGQADAALDSAHSAAVVDGMSADRRDSWTVGYTPRIVVAVHAARADGDALALEGGERAGSAPVWRALMNYLIARDDLPELYWQKPADVEEFLVCDISGQLPPAADHCPTRREIVPAGTALRRDTAWQTVEINSLTGQLATLSTPDSQRRSATYFTPPADIIDWWIGDGRPLPPSAYGVEAPAAAQPIVQLTQPSDFAYVGGQVPVAGRVSAAGAQSYALEYGPGVKPSSWLEIVRESLPSSPADLEAVWHASELRGVYTLKLSALMGDGRTVSDTRQITLDNSPPTVELRLSEGGHAIRYPAQRVVSLLADASDNLAVTRVEFYQDEELLGVDREWPYGFEYELDGVGDLNFAAKAFDQVGNSADSVLRVTVAAG